MMKTNAIQIVTAAAITLVLAIMPEACAESKIVTALDTFASRAELRASTGIMRVINPPPGATLEVSELEMYLGEPHGTGFWHRRVRAEINSSRTLQPILGIGETQGGRWRIPVNANHLRAIIPGYAERHIIETHFTEPTSIPNVYNFGSFIGINTYTYSLSSQWDMLKNRTMEFSFTESKVRSNSTCVTSNPNCRPTMRSDIWRVELYPKNPGRYDWNLRFERHDRERFSNIGYHVRVQGDYEVYRGLRLGLTLGRFYNGANPAGEEFSEFADQLVFQYLNGGSTTFNKFYTRTFAFYKITAGYKIEF